MRTLLIFGLIMCCGCTPKPTKFGKRYNSERIEYGSPVIHDYMELKSTSEDFEHWRTPDDIIGTFEQGFHYGKGFYIHDDSVLQEDDVFRIRINDTTYHQVNILTYGNSISVEFDCSSFKVDSREVKQSAMEYLNSNQKFPQYNKQEITIIQADSILLGWGVNIRKAN